MFKIFGNTIIMPRGDSLHAVFRAVEPNHHDEWVPEFGDVISFFVQEKYGDDTVLIEKEIPHDTMTLSLEPSDTSSMDLGKYAWGIVVIKSNGDVDTIIGDSDNPHERGVLVLTNASPIPTQEGELLS